MLGNFSYCNPTKLYFGEDALENLIVELAKYGNNVALVYGSGSIKKNGIYDEIMDILKSAGKTVSEIAGVMPNPTVHKLYEGVEIARTHTGKGVLFGDLVQEGNIGLLEAMAIYQGKDAEGFLAHAKSAVEDSILDAIAIQRGSDSVGEAMAIKANRLDDASTFLSKELGREPKIEELAKYLSMTEEEVKEVMKISLDALSVMEADIKQS